MEGDAAVFSGFLHFLRVLRFLHALSPRITDLAQNSRVPRAGGTGQIAGTALERLVSKNRKDERFFAVFGYAKLAAVENAHAMTEQSRFQLCSDERVMRAAAR